MTAAEAARVLSGYASANVASALRALAAYARAASGSLWPALAFHIANNVAVVLALHHGWQPPATALALAATVAAAAVGLTLVVRSRA